MRPATSIQQILRKSKSTVLFTYNHETVNAKSIMNILMMVAKKDTEIEVSMEGEDALETMDLLEKAFATGFGEEDGQR
jgi:phosphocarrier protein